MAVGVIGETTIEGIDEVVQEPKLYILVNLVLWIKFFSLLILVAWGMLNQNQEGAR